MPEKLICTIVLGNPKYGDFLADYKENFISLSGHIMYLDVYYGEDCSTSNEVLIVPECLSKLCSIEEGVVYANQLFEDFKCTNQFVESKKKLPKAPKSCKTETTSKKKSKNKSWSKKTKYYFVNII